MVSRMTTSQKNTLVGKDNGYFEQWVRPCGHRYRVQTEYHQWELRRGADGAKLRTKLRNDASARPCRACIEAAS